MGESPPSTPSGPERRGRSTAAWWGLCVAVFSLGYLATCQRGFSWQDSGTFQRRVQDGDYSGDLGLALAHPLYIAAGQAVRAVPLGPFAMRLNAFSGVGMAVALANLMAVVTLLTGRRWIGLATAGMLAVCHTAWWLSTIAEVYTWSAAGLTGELWLLAHLLRRPRWGVLAGLAFVCGLGWCVHNFVLLGLPVYLAVAVVLVRTGRLRAWSLAIAAAAFALGAAPYLVMIVQKAAATGRPGAAVVSALVGEYGPNVFNLTDMSDKALSNTVLMGMNAVSLLVPLAVVGWFALRRRAGAGAAAAIAALTVIHILFVARYNVQDQFTFFLPSLVMIALAAGLGLAELAERSRRWRIAAIAAAAVSIALPPAFYAAAPALARAAGYDLPERHRFRDELRYWMVPWKHDEDSAERFAAAALRQAAPDGVILTDSTADDPLRLVQRRDGLGGDVSFQLEDRALPSYEADPATFRSALGGRTLYLYHRPAGRLADDAEFARGPTDALYRLTRWRPRAQ